MISIVFVIFDLSFQNLLLRRIFGQLNSFFCYILNVSADMSFYLLQVFYTELELNPIFKAQG